MATKSQAVRNIEDVQFSQGLEINTLKKVVNALQEQVEDLKRDAIAPPIPLPTCPDNVRVVLCSVRPDLMDGNGGRITYRKIESIKTLRRWSTLGLKDAKDVIDSLPRLVTLRTDGVDCNGRPRTVSQLGRELVAAGLVFVMIPD